MKNLQEFIFEAFNDAKNGDEFYTRIEDIEKGLQYFKLSGKIIYCNCDNPEFSNFYKYLKDNFSSLGLKKLMATYYSENPELVEYDGKNENRTSIKSGSFQDNEQYIEECDMIITNPPYSNNMPIELIELCYKHKTDFAFIGPLHLIINRKVKDYIISGKLNSIPATVNKFNRPDGNLSNAPACWFTNIRVNIPEFELNKTYNINDYKKYSNYDAIECNKSQNIPDNYYVNIGVPYRFFTKINRKQFEIVDILNNPKLNGKNLMARLIIKRKQ